jgi:D-sedoheptulose 7-phosphate isomerase
VTASFAEQYLAEVVEIARTVPANLVDGMATRLADVRSGGGRLFVIGVGGGAAHASHAVNDFRKLCALEAYAPTDNVSELTARVNDDGWETVFEAWLRASRLGPADAVLVFSVGGGSIERNLSPNIARAVELAKDVGATVLGIVGRSDGTTAQLADVAIVVEAPPERITPHVEGFQAVLWHLLVTHPALASRAGTWETVPEQVP